MKYKNAFGVIVCSLVRSVTPVYASSIATLPLALENSHICSAKSSIAKRVTHRVNGAVDVTKVIKKVPQFFRDATGASGNRLKQHQNVVRRPGDDER